MNENKKKRSISVSDAFYEKILKKANFNIRSVPEQLEWYSKVAMAVENKFSRKEILEIIEENNSHDKN